MDIHEITPRIFEHTEILSAHEQEIKTLFKQQKNIEALTESTQNLAISVKEIAMQQKDICDRLADIEDEKKQKNLAIWQAAVSAVVGGVVTYLVTSLF